MYHTDGIPSCGSQDQWANWCLALALVGRISDHFQGNPRRVAANMTMAQQVVRWAVLCWHWFCRAQRA